MKKTYNCIIVFDQSKKSVLFCKRQNDPFKGLYNFVGGKVELNEDSETAAYRELFEETGISRRQIELFRLMDIRYYYQDFDLELYVGKLDEDVTLVEEKNPLIWMSVDEDFTDRGRFAGEQNIAHIMNIAMMFPIPDRGITRDGLYIGVDGCRGGWIAAVLDWGDFRLERYDSINSLLFKYPEFDAFLIDMAVGLRNDLKQMRPDDIAKRELGKRASSVFPIPSRNAVYAEGEEAQKRANIRDLGKSLSKQTIAIIPKIRELDEFLTGHPEYKNRILESHPEVDFARLNGSVLLSRKQEEPGISDRKQILSRFIGERALLDTYDRAKEMKCRQDDLIDAACLAVTGALSVHGMCEVLPDKPESDAHGLKMQLVVPKRLFHRES